MTDFRILGKTYTGVNEIQLRDINGTPINCAINSTSWDAMASRSIGNDVILNINPSAYSFYNCDLRTLTLNNSAAATTGTYSFSNCTQLESVTINCENGAITTGSYAFNNCTKLQNVSFINCEEGVIPGAGSYSFNGCSNLTTLITPYNFGLSDHSFTGCSKLGPYFIGDVAGVYTECFKSCSSLLGLDLGPNRLGADTTRANMLNGATKCRDLIIRKTNAIWALQATNAFTNTPFASGKAGGILYVPSDLISTYQSASNWTTFFNPARAAGYAKNHISPIENSVYQYLFLDETPISNNLGTIPTLKVFKGKGIDSTGITTDANMAITAPFIISTANPINIHWNKFEATGATCAFKNCLTSTTDIDTSTEGNFIPHDMKGLDGTNSTFTEWMTAGGVNFIGKVENDLFADTTYSTSNGYGRLVFKNKTSDSSPISDTIEGYVTIQGTLYHLVETPIEEYE